MLAVGFIYFRLKDDFFNHLPYIYSSGTSKLWWIILALLLMPLNWGIEALKWKYAIADIQAIGWKKALKHVFSGITIGLATPNRLGEIPARVYLLHNNEQLTPLIGRTFLASFSQVLMTFIGGFIAVLMLKNHLLFGEHRIIWLLLVFGGTTMLLLFYFASTIVLNQFKKIPWRFLQHYMGRFRTFSAQKKWNLFLLSGLRYIVFVIQYYVILWAFQLPLNSLSEILLIPLFFMVSSVIPTLVISEIAVRGSVAIIIFSTVSSNDVALVMAAVTLWIINVALPAIIGIGGLKRFKI